MILSKKISQYGEDTYRDLFEELFDLLLIWHNKHPEIIYNIDYINLKINFFYFLLMNSKHLSDYNENVNMKYSESIVDLFLKMKDTCSSYCSNILNEKNRSSNDIFEFIFTYSFLNDTINEENENDITEEIIFDYEY